MCDSHGHFTRQVVRVRGSTLTSKRKGLGGARCSPKVPQSVGGRAQASTHGLHLPGGGESSPCHVDSVDSKARGSLNPENGE